LSARKEWKRNNECDLKSKVKGIKFVAKGKLGFVLANWSRKSMKFIQILNIK
jgi:hypothetical protein